MRIEPFLSAIVHSFTIVNILHTLLICWLWIFLLVPFPIQTNLHVWSHKLHNFPIPWLKTWVLHGLQHGFTLLRHATPVNHFTHNHFIPPNGSTMNPEVVACWAPFLQLPSPLMQYFHQLVLFPKILPVIALFMTFHTRKRLPLIPVSIPMSFLAPIRQPVMLYKW